MKQINRKDVENILYRYPNNIIKNLNIYNNNNNNNNILFSNNAEYFILKPKGKKSYLWFTYIEKKILAILIFMNNKNINDPSNEFYEYPIKFDNNICYNNTLLFGYYLTDSTNNIIKHYFIIENIFNYNIYNKIIQNNNFNLNFNYKLNLYNNILPKLHNINNYYINLPIILSKSEDVFKKIYNLNYNIFNIAAYSKYKYLGSYNLYNSNNNNNNNNNNNKLIATFKISACINQDLYNLFILNDKNQEEFYDLALIDTYKNSLFMNKLFRTIRENINLDYLEESDDDEIFENINVNKFVNLEKKYLIDCEYNSKFKKWIPKKISNNNKIITKKNLDLILAKKKNIYLYYK